MKQRMHALYTLFFAAIFIGLVFAMHTTAIGGLHSYVLEAAIAVVIIGPLSLASLAVCAAAAKIACEPKKYTMVRGVIATLAAIQLISMATYFILIWRGE